MADFQRHRWVKFNQAMVVAVCLVFHLAQTIYWWDVELFSPLLLFCPFWSVLSFAVMLILTRPVNRLLAKTPIGAMVEGGVERTRMLLGALTGLSLSLLMLVGLFAVLAQISPTWGAVGLFVALLAALALILPRMEYKPVLKQMKGAISPEEALKPLRALSIFDWVFPDQAALLAARPDSWRDQWPDDPALIDLRDRFNRSFRLVGGWPNAAFLPEDELLAIAESGSNKAVATARLSGEVKLVGVLEECFNIKISSKLIAELTSPGLTYLDFLTRLLDKLPLDYADRMDAVFNQPFSLPKAYYENLPWWGGVSKKFHLSRVFVYDKMRWRQALRSPKWLEKWPDQPGLAERRQQIGRIIAEEFNWFDEAFLPDDQVDALIHHFGSQRDFNKNIKILNRMLGTRLTVADIADGRLTFKELLKLVERQPEYSNRAR